METTVNTADGRKVTIKTVKSSARAATDLLGHLEILKGADVILTVWSWEIQALTAEGDDACTVVMKGRTNWSQVVDVPLHEVRAAMATAMALWQTHKTAENLAFLKARS